MGTLYLDGVIFSLQAAGGISVYFSELILRLEKYLDKEEFIVEIGQNNNRILQEYNQTAYVSQAKGANSFISRYLDLSIPSGVKVFHSSYYRIPNRKCRDSVKVITTVHDFTYEVWGQGIRKHIHHWQKKRAVMNSDVIICISESTKSDLLRFIPESRFKDIVVIYNGVSDNFYPLEDSTISSIHKNDYVLFVGARDGYKNFNMLVDALADFTCVDLVIIGGGELSPKEIEFLNQKLPDRYLHKGFVSTADLNVLYNKAHCLVYPSFYEGFGIPAIEAMKASCPVIAANASSLPEVCNDAAILIDDISPKSIEGAIHRLFDVDFREYLISLGIENSKRFSWDNTYDQLIKIYKE